LTSFTNPVLSLLFSERLLLEVEGLSEGHLLVELVEHVQLDRCLKLFKPLAHVPVADAHVLRLVGQSVEDAGRDDPVVLDQPLILELEHVLAVVLGRLQRRQDERGRLDEVLLAVPLLGHVELLQDQVPPLGDALGAVVVAGVLGELPVPLGLDPADQTLVRDEGAPLGLALARPHRWDARLVVLPRAVPDERDPPALTAEPDVVDRHLLVVPQGELNRV